MQLAQLLFRVFDRLANGDVPPKRFLIGPSGQVGIDPIANVLIVKSGGGMMIFDRKANGMDKPLRVIRGPNSMVGGGRLARPKSGEGPMSSGLSSTISRVPCLL